jgi:CBS domain-containing protein
MLCKQIMKRDIAHVSVDDSVRSAAARMRADNIGFLPVCDASGRVVGTLTDRDITVRVVADDLPADTLVDEVMTREVVACSPSDDVHRAELLMGKYKKSRMICVDDSGHPVGVISLSDIAQNESSEQTARTMRRVTMREVHL